MKWDDFLLLEEEYILKPKCASLLAPKHGLRMIKRTLNVSLYQLSYIYNQIKAVI